MAPGMDELVQCRGRLKSSITRALAYAEKPPEDCTLEHASIRLDRLDKWWLDFIKVTNELYAFSESTGYVNPDDDFSVYEEKYLNACACFNNLKLKLTPASQKSMDNVDSINKLAEQQAEFLQRLSTTPSTTRADTELPRINITPFTGQYKQWPSFRDLFVSTIDSKTNLTDTQKFHYLKSLLAEDAAKLVQHIPVTNSAYKTAWNRLNERYDRARHIIYSFIDSFMEIQPVLQENATQLRNVSDGANEIIRGLDAIGHTDRDSWVIYLLLSKIDPDSRRKWIYESRDQTSPSIEEFFQFLDNRCEELELTANSTVSNSKSKLTNSHQRSRSLISQSGEKHTQKCMKCSSNDHSISKCTDFLSMNIDDRRSFIKSKSLCFNCLKLGHTSYTCKSKFKCRECNRRHHTLVHSSPQESHSTSPSTTSSNIPINGPTPLATAAATPWSSVSHIARSPVISNQHTLVLSTKLSMTTPAVQRNSYILPTALVNVRNSQGGYITCRVLLDSASELSYVTERCAQSLGLPRSSSRIMVSGISSVQGDTTRGSCTVQIKSKVSSYGFSACLHILKNITSPLPTTTMRSLCTEQLQGLPLADPSYYKSSNIDILLGAEYVWNIFMFDKIFDKEGNPIAISTTLGWVVTSIATLKQSTSCSLVSLADIDSAIRRFWEIEEPQNTITLDPENAAAEQHFVTTHHRHSDGKYIIRLPFKSNPAMFGDTLQGALSRFSAVERRLLKNKNLRDQYISFMREYERLGHMKQIPQDNILVDDGSVFYMPHHPVLGKKLRVVFDGSFRDSNGNAINDSLHVGPSLQRNLFVVCLRFRMHKFVFSADIIKMFRQIWVAEDERNFQRIVWREDPSKPITHYQLCTVTYGTTCAPFLSVRVLEQLAYDYKQQYPNAAEIILKDFYVDDVLTGCSTEEELIEKRDELVKLLSLAGFELDKWVSNSCQITNGTSENMEQEFLKFADDTKKVLGLFWNPYNDILGYKMHLDPHATPTKRQVLSDVSRLFDPLGLLAPVVVQFKILFQELWLINLNWDDPLPEKLSEWWLKARNSLQNLGKLSLPRFVHNTEDFIELHGFSDASIKAYSAVVYCRSVDSKGSITTTLISAKTRVAPLKQQSLPRLELSGALLLTKLIKTVTCALPYKNIKTIAWCDSTVVLSWLSRPPIKLKTFVANRTSEILGTLPRSCWHHVATNDNPADCASRGMLAETLIGFELWWKGPHWLRNEHEYRQILNLSNRFNQSPGQEAEKEFRTNATNLLIVNDIPNPITLLINRVSSWRKLTRVVAYLLRFVRRLRSSNRIISTGSLIFNELNDAGIICILHAQEEFASERASLQSGEELGYKSKLLKLKPFIDKNGIIRVGGRIGNSVLNAEVQHPIILSKHNRITSLIIQDEHEKHLHPGVSALFVIIRQKYWIFGARNLIRQHTHKCLKCFRFRQLSSHQQMADLPGIRVRQAHPFEHSGCDYAGPITLKMYRGRNARTSKGYICLFVCMVTSAIHLELATDLTTECFLAALRRFISRRGKCSQIFSDNGRNFTGASRILNEMHKVIMSQQRNEIVSASLAEDGIRWSFIPPNAPHWGGIWESAVRSVKLHLRRVIGATILTYEQMHTLLAQIEAVVNSRPLGVAPDSDVNYLSPSHFLIGRPYTMVPEADLVDVNPNKLDYWQHVQNMLQGFWRRWHTEYLTSLQNRPKWALRQPNIKVGDIAVIKEQSVPPAKWPMAKVIEVYPGDDGLVRVVKLRTQQGVKTRPITKIVVLPLC